VLVLVLVLLLVVDRSSTVGTSESEYEYEYEHEHEHEHEAVDARTAGIRGISNSSYLRIHARRVRARAPRQGKRPVAAVSSEAHAMSLSKLLSLFALASLTSLSVAACAASTDPTDDNAAGSTDQELKKSVTSCRTDDDCTAVAKGGCCNNGWLFAVNVHKVKQYEDATKCTANPRPMCPLYIVHDTRVPACVANTCEMVAADASTDAGASDCRSTGCDAGKSCSVCWGGYACIPDGAKC
jgi:hypothetical protein